MNYTTLETIKKAGRSRIILRIIYTEKDGVNEGWRHIEPYSLSGDGNNYALFAWDIEKGGIRRFTLSRIDDVELTAKTFIPRYPVEIL